MGLKDYIVKNIVVSYLSSWLSKLPFDGWKTALGVLLIVLGELLKVMPQYSGSLAIVVEILRQLPSDPITDAGIVSLLVGVVHKVLKYFSKDVPESPVIVSIK